MKHLIVNGDDFGASHGVNLGIIEAHERGILRSTSMMVDRPASAEAARLSASNPALGVGLHVVLRSPADVRAPEAEISRQLERFIDLTGQPPTHLDAHHNVQRDHRLLPAFLAVADSYELPLRGHCGVRHIPSFYGQWDGETDLEQVGPQALARIVATEVKEGFNELCCHPGYPDDELASSYTLERQAELTTLCDPELPALLEEHGVELANFRDLARP